MIGKTASSAAVAAAPIAGAVRSRPSPSGPVARMSLANTGSIAVAPPNSTANRSSEIAPSTTGRDRTKRNPSSTVCQLAGSVLRIVAGIRTDSMKATDTISSTVTTV